MSCATYWKVVSLFHFRGRLDRSRLPFPPAATQLLKRTAGSGSAIPEPFSAFRMVRKLELTISRDRPTELVRPWPGAWRWAARWRVNGTFRLVFGPLGQEPLLEARDRAVVVAMGGADPHVHRNRAGPAEPHDYYSYDVKRCTATLRVRCPAQSTPLVDVNHSRPWFVSLAEPGRRRGRSRAGSAR